MCCFLLASLAFFNQWWWPYIYFKLAIKRLRRVRQHSCLSQAQWERSMCNAISYLMTWVNSSLCRCFTGMKCSPLSNQDTCNTASFASHPSVSSAKIYWFLMELQKLNQYLVSTKACWPAWCFISSPSWTIWTLSFSCFLSTVFWFLTSVRLNFWLNCFLCWFLNTS